jgi:hypothetical protein
MAFEEKDGGKEDVVEGDGKRKGKKRKKHGRHMFGRKK